MRTIPTILLFAIASLAFGQGYDPEHPFQVIYAENVETNKGEVVKSLDLVLRSEVLTIRQDGYLAMIHHFGFPVELSGDTILKVRDINAEFEKLAEDKLGKAYLYGRRPNIDLLFITDPIASRKNRVSTTGAVRDHSPFRIAFPPLPGYIISYKEDLCLTWYYAYGKCEINEVSILNEYEEVFKTYTSTTNSLKIEASELQPLASKHKTLFLKLACEKPIKQSKTFLLREFPAGSIEFPYPCAMKKASHALVTGFSMEMSAFVLDNSPGAERYYRLATELSDKEFYRTMLENFLKRNP